MGSLGEVHVDARAQNGISGQLLKRRMHVQLIWVVGRTEVTVRERLGACPWPERVCTRTGHGDDVDFGLVVAGPADLAVDISEAVFMRFFIAGVVQGKTVQSRFVRTVSADVTLVFLLLLFFIFFSALAVFGL
jgi:hypothetical protein